MSRGTNHCGKPIFADSPLFQASIYKSNTVDLNRMSHNAVGDVFNTPTAVHYDATFNREMGQHVEVNGIYGSQISQHNFCCQNYTLFNNPNMQNKPNICFSPYVPQPTGTNNLCAFRLFQKRYGN